MFLRSEDRYNSPAARWLRIKPYVCSLNAVKTPAEQANVIVYNYLYMIDSDIDDMIEQEMKKDCIVVFDEAHNIDDICLEAYSIDINKRSAHPHRFHPSPGPLRSAASTGFRAQPALASDRSQHSLQSAASTRLICHLCPRPPGHLR